MLHLVVLVIFFVVINFTSANTDYTCGSYHGVSVTMKGSDGNLFWSLYKQNNLKSISGAEFTKVCIDYEDESGEYIVSFIPLSEDSGNSSSSGNSSVEVEVQLNDDQTYSTKFNSSNKAGIYQASSNLTVPNTAAPFTNNQFNISCGYNSVDTVTILISNPDPDNLVIWTFTRFDKFSRIGKGENFGAQFCLVCGSYRFDILSQKEGVASYTLIYNQSKTTVTRKFGFWDAHLIEYSCSSPTAAPTSQPMSYPSRSPLAKPSTSPSNNSSANPSSAPSSNPSTNPSANPSFKPSSQPSFQPTFEPTFNPTIAPSESPTHAPTDNSNSCVGNVNGQVLGITTDC
jgi:hypothetical protein